MKNKQIDYISKTMRKHHCVFTDNFTMSSSNAGKSGILRPLEIGRS